MISVYLDVCCLNRPFDDQSQERVRLEADAIKSITRRMDNSELIGVGSTAVLTEIDNNRDQERKAQLHKTASAVKKFIKVEEKQNQRAIELQGMGFHFFDALHIACAEEAGVDVLLTTDDRFLRLASRLGKQLTVRVANPVNWLLEIINNGRNDG